MFPRRPAAILLLSATVLTGCAVGPDYKSPQIALSSQFLGQEVVEQREGQSKADLRTWWASFDDPTLTRFVTLALDQNLDIAQAAICLVAPQSQSHMGASSVRTRGCAAAAGCAFTSRPLEPRHSRQTSGSSCRPSWLG